MTQFTQITFDQAVAIAENPESEDYAYWRLNDSGKLEIKEWAERVLKKPEYFEAYFSDAENGAGAIISGGVSTIEAHGVSTLSRNPETLDLGAEHFDWMLKIKG